MISEAFIEEYGVTRRVAGLAERRDRTWIVVSGRDRLSYLHGLLTNDTASLEAGQGRYAAYLTPQGRMIADVWTYELGDVLLLAVPSGVKDTMLAKLDQFIFSEDVQLGDVSGTFGALTVVGPRAAAVAAAPLELTDARLTALGDHGNLRASFDGESAIVLNVPDFGQPAFEILVPVSRKDALGKALRDAGARDVSGAVLDALRIEAGIPRFHQDMDEETIPLEAGLEERAISLTKGCYVGQEVIIRVLHRGHGRVARKLVGLRFEPGASPERGQAIAVDGREIGHITSQTWSPALGRPIALGYVQRDFITPGTQVTVGGEAAEVSALPFAR